MIQKLKKMNCSGSCSKMSKALKISVIINIIFVSLIIGKAICVYNYSHEHTRYKDILPEQQVKQFRKNIKANKKLLVAALLEEPFNEQKVRFAFSNLDNAIDKTRTVLNNTIIEKASKLSPEERIKLLPKHLKKNFKDKHKKPMF